MKPDKPMKSEISKEEILKPEILKIENLDISFPTSDGQGRRIVSDAALTIKAGEIMAVVGESGSGKTMLARSILQLLPSGGYISKGTIDFKGQDLSKMAAPEIRKIRGAEISMIFQEPMVSLNPTLKIGFQLCEAMSLHTDIPRAEIRRRAIDLLTRVRIQDPESCMDKYAHEFSGGMRQRIMIASCLMMKPKLLIADEPTTALDCLVQKEVLDILMEIAAAEGTAILFITHDLGLVAQYGAHVTVMEKGQIVEQGRVDQVIENPQHSYTKKLLSSLPQTGDKKENLQQRPNYLEVKDLVVEYPLRRKWLFEKQKYIQILHGISLNVGKGEFYAIVGESGSGKTTLGRAILGLVKAKSGKIKIGDQEITSENPPTIQEMSRQVQLIFQDPFSSLSPRQKIGDIIAEPLNHDQSLTAQMKRDVRDEMMTEVGLPLDFSDRYPNELSGGQRQRVSIARARIMRPELIIADEPVSALDITIQAQILALLERLKDKYNFTCLFISHDLSVVEQVADKVAVLYKGHIVEQGICQDIFANPQHEYTKKLLTALPKLYERADGSYGLKQRNFKK